MMTVALPYCYVNKDLKETTNTKLLLLSIFVKWNPIAMGCHEDIGGGDCILCKYYLGYGCILCPVYKKTKQSGCKSTPYMTFISTRNVSERYDAIEKEIEFLISLLDKETQKNLENIFIEWCKDGGK